MYDCCMLCWWEYSLRKTPLNVSNCFPLCAVLTRVVRDQTFVYESSKVFMMYSHSTRVVASLRLELMGFP